MQTEPAANQAARPRKVAVVQRGRPKQKTPLARRRRLNTLVRQLASDLGFDLAAVTLAERGVIHQCASLLLQVEIAQDQLVGGAIIDADVCIRLSSEARRLLAGLRKRAGQDVSRTTPPWSPLRSRINAPTMPPQGEPEAVREPEPEAAA
jgi:hypothetical protein